MQTSTAIQTALNNLTPDNTKPYPLGEAVKSLVSQAVADAAKIAHGEVVGVAAGLDVTTPFDPDVVIIWNQTNAVLGVHFGGMGNSEGAKLKQGAFAHVGANGLTLGTGKFSIGTDSDFNGDGDAIHYIAIDL